MIMNFVYFGIIVACCLMLCCGNVSENSNIITKERDISSMKPSLIKEKDMTNSNYFTFLQKFFMEDTGKFGYYKVIGIKPAEDFRRKKLNVDEFSEEKKVVISPQFEDALQFSEGLAAVKYNGLWGLIDEHNSWQIEPVFNEIGEHYSSGDGIAFRDKLAPAVKDKLWGYINSKGDFVIPPSFSKAKCFSEGIAFVKTPTKNTWSMIDKTGKVIKHTNFQVVQPFSEGMAAVLPSNSAWCYIDKSGEVIINFKKKGFEMAYSFSNGMALVKPRNKYFGFINTEGKLVIPDAFVEALGFSYELAAVKKAKLWGFINKKGNWIIPPSFNFANSFIQFPDGSVAAKVRQDNLIHFILNPQIN